MTITGLSEGMHMGDFDQWDGFDGLNTHGGFRDPQLGDYLFEEENVFRAVGDPLVKVSVSWRKAVTSHLPPSLSKPLYRRILNI
jgi:hypothetical protein